MAIVHTDPIISGGGGTRENIDPITGLPYPEPGIGINPATGLMQVNVDYSGKSKNPYSGDGGRDPYSGKKLGGLQPLSFTPPPATAATPNPNINPVTGTNGTTPTINEYNQNRNNWYVAKGAATIKKPDGTEVPNPFDLTAEQIYFALSGNPQAILRLKKSLEDSGHGDMFHNIVNYYEPGGGAYNGGGYTAEDSARAAYNYAQGSRGTDAGGAKLGEAIGDKSPEALAYMIANGQAVKGADGKYYAPSDPYYTPGVGAGAGTKEGNAYNQGLDYNAAQAQLPGTYTIPGSTLKGGSNSGGTTPPPAVSYNPLDAENPWFAKQPVNTEKAAAPVIPGVNSNPKSTTTTSSTTTSKNPTPTSPPPSTTNGAVSPTINQLVRTTR